MVPGGDGERWPTLGPGVCHDLEASLVHGPGDVRGERVKLSAEQRGWIYRLYEVFPDDHERAGRRRFKRGGLSLPKGVAKTEFAAFLAAMELSPRSPVRTIVEDGRPLFDGQGRPIGGPVTDPYIPMIAFTEEQSDELAYGALRVILELSPIADLFDIGLERIMRLGGDGRAEAVAGSPSARDGARTTFNVFDETHRFVLQSLRRAHRTMLANVPKRRAADAWSIEVTTAYEPGENSVAEATMEYAREVERGRVKDPQLFFYHVEAGEEYDVTDSDQLREAITEVRGSAAAWSDIDAIAAQWDEPDADRAYLERTWLNRPKQGASQAFDIAAWDELAEPHEPPPAGTKIALGFDGSRTKDATGIVGTVLVSGWQWPLGLWERPRTAGADWEVPEREVDAVMAEAFATYDVARLYADPPYWESWVSAWAGRYGDSRVFKWYTNRLRQMAYAVRSFTGAIAGGEVSHSGDLDLRRHLGNAVKKVTGFTDDEGAPLWVVTKDRQGSPDKIDLALCSILSWEARNDAIAKGALLEKPKPKKARAFAFGPGADDEEDEEGSGE